MAAASRSGRAEDAATTVPTQGYGTRSMVTTGQSESMLSTAGIQMRSDTTSAIETDSSRATATTVLTAGYSIWVIFARWRPR